MSAIAEACRDLGGSYALGSERGTCTRMIFTLPMAEGQAE